ncbi:MAG: ABC transporter permease [Deinococcota bacterium]
MLEPAHATIPRSSLGQRWGQLIRTLRVGRWLTGLAILVVIITIVAAVFAPLLSDRDPTLAVPASRLQPPGQDGHVLGTDLLGRDIYTRLLYGARLAWLVGGTVAGISVLVGSLLGALAGYFDGWLNEAISRLIDAVLAFPALLLALVLAAIYGPSTRTAIVALSVAYVPLVARVVRAVVLRERELDYVRASRGLGNPEWLTLWRHIIPNTLGPLLVVATIVASRAIIVESSLSFLGAGTQAPLANWGLMVRDGRDVILQFPRLLLVPALTLSLTVLAINLVADALGDYVEAGQLDAGEQVDAGEQA